LTKVIDLSIVERKIKNSEVFEFKGKWYISVAERLPGNEQYIEFMRFYWNEDGSVSVGDFVREPV
jgi:hypothetical protein